MDYHTRRNASERFMLMCKALHVVIAEFNPEVVVLEDVVLQRSPKTMKVLATLLGNLCGACDVRGISAKILPASTWRKAVGISGGRGTKREEFKERAIDFVMSMYGIEVAEDVAEAVCLGAGYIKMLEENTVEH